MTERTADDESLEFNGRLELPDVQAFHRCLGLLRFSRPFRWLLHGFLAALLGVVVLMMLVAPDRRSAQIKIALGIALIWIGGAVERRIRVKRNYLNHPELYPQTLARFTREAVYLETEEFKFEMRWSHLGNLVQTPSGLLFRDRIGQALCWLPQRLFEGNDQRERLLALARLQGLPVITLR